MVKVLVILGGLGREGITNSVLTYLEAIDKSDIDIHLGIGDAECEALEWANNIGIALHMLPSRNQKPIQYFYALKKFVRMEKFAIVHVHGNSATLGLDLAAAKLGGVHIRIAHSHTTSCTHPFVNYFMKPLFYANCTTRFACGINAGKWMFNNRTFQIIPNGKDIKRFIFDSKVRTKMRKENHLHDQIVIGHVGAFENVKNHTFLIDTFKHICNEDNHYVLWLIGEGNEKKQIEDKVRAYGIENSVVFWGFQPNIEKFLCAMDIAVLPSLYEGLPNVVIEWQISGLPCLLSDRITRECCITDTVTYLPLESGTAAWAGAIKNIEVKDRNGKQNMIMKKMREAGFDIKQNAENLKKLYLKLALEKG